MYGVTGFSCILYFLAYVQADEPKCPNIFMSERLMEKMLEIDFKLKKSYDILEIIDSRESNEEKTLRNKQEFCTTDGINVCQKSLQSCVPSRDLITDDVEGSDWRMVFRANSGNGHNAYEAWVSGKDSTTEKPATFARSRGPHFRDKIVPGWSSLGIKLVKFALYDHDREVAHVMFDGNGSDVMNWFSKNRVISSSYSDLTSSDVFNIFSIEGTYITDALDRRFLINRSYGVCDIDSGHIVVTDTKTITGCTWDKQYVYPQFLYSQINSADYWNRIQFGRADFLAIFIKT